MPEIEIIKRYKNLPDRIKKSMQGLDIRFKDLKEVKKVYWGGYVLVFPEEVILSFKSADLVANNVVHFDLIDNQIALVIGKEKV